MTELFYVADDGLVELRRRADGNDAWGRVFKLVGPGEAYRGIPYAELERAGSGMIIIEDGVATIGPDTRPIRFERFSYQTAHGIVITRPDGTRHRIVSPRIDRNGFRRKR
jgi:hypothetical protein